MIFPRQKKDRKDLDFATSPFIRRIVPVVLPMARPSSTPYEENLIFPRSPTDKAPMPIDSRRGSFLRHDLILLTLFALVGARLAWAAEPSGPMDCSAVEVSFKSHLLESIDFGHEAYKNSAECLKGNRPPKVDCDLLNQTNMEMVKDYRALIKKLYQDMGAQWLQDRKKSTGHNLSEQCYKSSSGGIEFQSHLRNLKIQNGDEASCNGEAHAWIIYRDENAARFLAGERPTPHLTAEERKRLQAYQKAPVMPILSDGAKWDTQLTDEQIQKDLASTMETLHQGIQSFRDRIAEFENRELYKLYEFKSQYEKFLQELPASERTIAQQCRDKSGWINDCSTNQLTRLGDRIWNLSKDLFPIVPIIDGLVDTNDAQAAKAAGVVSSEEETTLRSAAATKILFGLSGLNNTGKVGISIAKSAIAKASQKTVGLSLSNPRIAMSPTERTALLSRNFAFNEQARVSEASSVLGRKLSAQEGDIILQAHRAGAASLERSSKYSVTVLREKRKILENSGYFSKSEIDQLMRHGLTGESQIALKPVNEVLSSAGIATKSAESLRRNIGHKTMGELSSAETQQVIDSLTAQATRSARAGGVNEAESLYKTAYSLNTSIAQKVTQEGRQDAVDAYLSRSFTFREAYKPVVTRSRMVTNPQSDELFGLSVSSGYFRKVEEKGFVELYDPQSKRNLNLYDPRSIQLHNLSAEQVYLSNNRQLQELLILKSSNNMPPHELVKLPTYLRDLPRSKIDEYIRIYQKNLEILEQQQIKSP